MITKTVRLPLPVDAAFALFTDRADDWWPRERRHTDDPAAVILLDRGGLREAAPDGHATILGRTVTWEPPALLVLDFFPGTDAEHPTRVTVTFAGDGAQTLVTVRHAPTEASADLWESRAPRYAASWDLLLPALRSTAER